MPLEFKLYRKAKRVATTKTFIKDFPRGIEMLNVINDRYYFFDKAKDGTILQGTFTGQPDIFWQSRYDYVYDRKTKETYELGETVNEQE